MAACLGEWRERSWGDVQCRMLPGPVPAMGATSRPPDSLQPRVAKLSPRSQDDVILSLSTAFCSWDTLQGDLEPLLYTGISTSLRRLS